jgi:hypothetical protein
MGRGDTVQTPPDVSQTVPICCCASSRHTVDESACAWLKAEVELGSGRMVFSASRSVEDAAVGDTSTTSAACGSSYGVPMSPYPTAMPKTIKLDPTRTLNISSASCLSFY